MTIFGLSTGEEWLPVKVLGMQVPCHYDTIDASRVVFAPIVSGAGTFQMIDWLTADELRELADAMDEAREDLNDE